MTKLKLNIVMEGLIATAVEKIYVLGWEDAQEDVQRIIDMVNDLEMFWDEDGKLTRTDWSMKIAEEVEKARS